MNKDLFIHIGCTYSKEEILAGVQARDFEIVILDEIGIKPKLQLEYHSIFGLELQAVIEFIDKILLSKGLRTSHCHFFTLAEGSVDLLNSILKHYGKSPISEFSGNLRDKYWVRKRFEQAGIEKLRFLAKATNTMEIPTPSESDYPLIVKPVGSMASRNVSKVFNHDELIKGCLDIFTKNKTYMSVDTGEIVIEDVYGQKAFAVIESTLDGEKLSLEAIIVNGQIKFFATTSKFDSTNDFFYERADIVDPHFFDEHQNRHLESYLNRIVATLEIKSAILHVEVFLNRVENRFHLIEVNFRLGGESIHELVEKAYTVNMVADFLSSLQSSEHRIVPKKSDLAWVAYSFLTGTTGEFKSFQNEFKNSQIVWDYSNGDQISKLSTSRFSRVGTVLFDCRSSELKNVLHMLLNKENEFFQISGIENHDPTNSVRKKERDILKLIRFSSISIFLICSLIAIVGAYENNISQAENVAQTMAKTLSSHLASGEIYYVGNIVMSFQTGTMYSRITVTDKNLKNIYSSSNSPFQNLLYQEGVDISQFEKSLPILVDGLVIGYLAYDLNTNKMIVQILAFVLLFTGLTIGIYLVVVKYLFAKLSRAARLEAESFSALLNQLKVNLDNIEGTSGTMTFEQFEYIIKRDLEKNDSFRDVRKSLLNLIASLRNVRGRIVEKNRLADLLDESTRQLIKATAETEIAKIATQVSHDIRSPLSALDIVLSDIATLPEDKRILVRSATQRIKDIANNLIAKNRSKPVKLPPPKSDCLISSLLENIISEKRSQLRNRTQLSINLEVDEGYGLFAFINPIDLKILLSNLINNSAEAIATKGCIEIKLRCEGENVLISINDNGRGIPADIIPKLGTRGFSYEKNTEEAGTGLGLFHAQMTLEEWGGRLLIDSKENVGTSLTLCLPRRNSPSWFVQALTVKSSSKIAVIDDDASIHESWNERFKKIGDSIRLFHFSSANELESWLAVNTADLYLFDYELIGSSENGIEIIERLSLSEKSVLVTSHYEDQKIVEKCCELEIGLIPKGLTPYVPFKVI